MSISFAVRFRRLHRETGSVSPAKFGGYGEPPGFALGAQGHYSDPLFLKFFAFSPSIQSRRIASARGGRSGCLRRHSSIAHKNDGDTRI